MSPCFIPASASSSALPRPASVHTKASARSIASSSLYSIEDSLREIVGAVTVFNREQTDYCPGESSARNIDQLSGLSTAETPVTDTPPSPLPPPYREPRATASEFHLRIRELTEEAGAVVTDGPPVSARPTTPQRRAAVAPEHSIQGLVSALLAACTLRDDRRAKAKGKEKERAENDDSFDRGSSSRPHPRGNRRGGGFITPWTKKGSIRRTTIPIAQSENTLTTVAPKTQREEALAGQDLCRTIGPSDIVSVTFRASSGTEKTCWISLNVVDTWPVRCCHSFGLKRSVLKLSSHRNCSALSDTPACRRCHTQKPTPGIWSLKISHTRRSRKTNGRQIPRRGSPASTSKSHRICYHRSLPGSSLRSRPEF